MCSNKVFTLRGGHHPPTSQYVHTSTNPPRSIPPASLGELPRENRVQTTYFCHNKPAPRLSYGAGRFSQHGVLLRGAPQVFTRRRRSNTYESLPETSSEVSLPSGPRCAFSGRGSSNTTNKLYRTPGSASGGLADVWSPPVGNFHRGKGASFTVKKETTSVQRGFGFRSPGRISPRSRGRNSVPLEQGRNTDCPGGGKGVRSLLPLFPRAKARQGAATHPRFARSERSFEEIYLQNAYAQNTIQFYPTRGLVHYGRSERRIFSYRSATSTQKIFEICVSGSGVRVPEDAVRLLARSQSFYQVHRGRASPTEAIGAQDFGVHRPSMLHVQSAVRARHGFARVSSQRIGFQHQPRKELFDSQSRNRISGCPDQFNFLHRPTVSETRQLISTDAGSFPGGAARPVQDVPAASGSDGFYTGRCPAGSVEDERFSALGFNATSLSAEAFAPQGANHSAMPGGFTLVAESRYFPIRSTPRDGVSEESRNDGCLPYGLGRRVRGQNGKRHLAATPPQPPHKRLGVISGYPGAEAFPPSAPQPSCFDQVGQYDRGRLHKQTGRNTLSTAPQASERPGSLGQRAPRVNSCHARPGHSKLGGGSSLQGKSSLRRMENSPPGDQADLGEVRRGCRRSIRLARKRALPSLLLSGGDGRPIGRRRVGAPVAKRAALRVSTAESHPSHDSEGKRTRSIPTPCGTEVARENVDSRVNAAPPRRTVAAPPASRPSLSGTRADISSPSGPSGSLGLAPERFNLTAVGLPERVIATIQSARAPSTRALYGNKWHVFEKWCYDRHIVPFQCDVANMLCFLQSLLDNGKAFSTIKVYLSAISACHVGFDKVSVGKHPLVCRFMKGVRRLRPAQRRLFPSWNLSEVLEALSRPPFEPMDRIELKLLTLKTALLLALVSAKRVGELRALSVHPSCLRFDPLHNRVDLQPNPAFVPKVVDSSYRCSSFGLDAFSPPPFSSEEEARLNCLCPVRALSLYVARTRSIRKSDQMFVSWATSHLGLPISVQRLSHWLVEAIGLAYKARSLPLPERLRAHSTRGLATSWALFRGISVQDICAAACWENPHTFMRFYRLDVTAPSLAHAVLSVGAHSV